MNLSASSSSSSSPKPPLARRLWSALKEVVAKTGWLALAGIVAAIALLLSFAYLTEEVFDREFLSLDTGLELALHTCASPLLDTIFQFFTLIGGIGAMMLWTVLLAGGLAWRGRLRLAWFALLAVGGGIALDQLLKYVLQRPRPELWPVSRPRLLTYSFPSGHAMASLCFFSFVLWLAFHFRLKPWQKVACALLAPCCILMVGLSRVYFGVHYPTDVLGGYLAGGGWMLALFSGRGVYRRLHTGDKNNVRADRTG